ncbi:MAG: RecX family transcriptional regulator, partial [Ruthenibacterium sp.]
MKITRIGETKRGRFSLFDADDNFLFSVDGETMAKNKIVEGMELSVYDLEHLRTQSDARKAKDQALRYVSMRDYASKELQDKLCLKFDADTAAAAVAEMVRLDLLNDENFALHRAKYLINQKKSVREIARQLALKGIDKQTVASVLEMLSPEDDDACYALLQKSYRAKLLAGETDKVLAAMARRGFPYGAAKT